MERYRTSTDQKFNVLQVHFPEIDLLKLIYKIQVGYFEEIKLTLKFVWKCKESRVAKHLEIMLENLNYLTLNLIIQLNTQDTVLV